MPLISLHRVTNTLKTAVAVFVLSRAFEPSPRSLTRERHQHGYRELGPALAGPMSEREGEVAGEGAIADHDGLAVIVRERQQAAPIAYARRLLGGGRQDGVDV